MTTTEKAIHVSDKAKVKIAQLLDEASLAGDGSEYFLRVSVVGGGCSA